MRSSRFDTASFKPAFIAILVGVTVSLSVILIRENEWLQRTELLAYDFCLWAVSSPHPNDSKVVLIGITEEDINYLGRWPLTDEMLAELIEKVSSYNPRVIGVDIYRNIPVPPGENRLDKTFSRLVNIIAIEKFGGDDNGGIAPPKILDGSERVGFNDIIVDADGVVRRGILFLDDGMRTSHSFALRISESYLSKDGIKPQPGIDDPTHLRLGKTTFHPFESNDGPYVKADSRGYQYLLDFRDANVTFKSVSLKDVLTGQFPKDSMLDNIALIGVTARSVKDMFLIPNGIGGRENSWIYGLELHGIMTDQIIRAALTGREPIKCVSDPHEWIWIAIWGMAASLVGTASFSLWMFAIVAAGGAILIGACGYIAFDFGLWIPLAPPILTWFGATLCMTAYGYSSEKAQRDILMKIFSRHVSREVASEIWSQRNHFMNGGKPLSQKLTATVLFTDMKGFTSVSEKLPPEELMGWLNEYMEVMTSVVLRHGGLIDKYIGDAIMSVFGIPVPRTSEAEIKNDAINAVECALDMELELIKLNEKWIACGLPSVKMRVGIFTGPLVAGGLGSAERMDYTVIGDTVNTASRLESYGKDGDINVDERLCRVLVGETTYNHLDNRFQSKLVGRVMLKGKDESLNIYLVFGRLAK